MIPQQAKEATGTNLDQLCINTIRTLAIDGVQKANSGHPGTPLGAAPTAYALWQKVMRYDPNTMVAVSSSFSFCQWLCSCSLGTVLIHLTGIKAANESYTEKDRLAVTLDDIKTFRLVFAAAVQVILSTAGPRASRRRPARSRTGHFGTCVGMAIAQQWLAATYNRPGFDLFDFNVYAPLWSMDA